MPIAVAGHVFKITAVDLSRTTTPTIKPPHTDTRPTFLLFRIPRPHTTDTTRTIQPTLPTTASHTMVPTVRFGADLREAW